MSFTQLIQKYQSVQDKHGKQEVFKQLLTQLKKQSGEQIKKILQTHYQKLYYKLLQNYQYSITFLFQNLSIQDCFVLVELEKSQLSQSQNIIVKLIIGLSKQIIQVNQIQWFSKMYTRQASIQKVLVYLKLVSQYYHMKISDNYFSQFLADFVKASAFAIQIYLKLKSQSPKFDVDYIEYGQKIVKYTPKWIKQSYLTLLNTLRVTQNIKIRLSIFNAIYQIIGALMQIQRQGNIQTQICDEILNSCFIYVSKCSSLEELHQSYINELKKSNWNILPEKIKVPEKYSFEQIKIPKSAFVYLVFRFIKQSQKINIYSNSKTLKYLTVALNELAPYQYEIKNQINALFIDKIKKVKVKTCFQFQFPLIILWFNLYHHEQKNNKQTFKILSQIFQQQLQIQTYLNSLKIITNYHIEDLNTKINQFIAKKTIQIYQKSEKDNLNILLKIINWDLINKPNQNIFVDLIKKSDLSTQNKKELIQKIQKIQNIGKNNLRIQIVDILKN